LTSINIDSAGGIFTGDAAGNLGGSFDNDADGNIFKATFGGSFGSVSFSCAVEAQGQAAPGDVHRVETRLDRQSRPMTSHQIVAREIRHSVPFVDVFLGQESAQGLSRSR
jgi:hypothetical protein